NTFINGQELRNFVYAINLIKQNEKKQKLDEALLKNIVMSSDSSDTNTAIATEKEKIDHYQTVPQSVTKKERYQITTDSAYVIFKQIFNQDPSDVSHKEVEVKEATVQGGRVFTEEQIKAQQDRVFRSQYISREKDCGNPA